MLSFLIVSMQALPVAVLMAALAAWLGKVWATRIAREDSFRFEQALENIKANFSREVEGLKGTIDLQNTLVKQVQQSVNMDIAEVSREQIKNIQIFWNYWIEFRQEIMKFHTPHQLLKSTELNDPSVIKKFFPYEPDQISESLSKSMKHYNAIERIRPMIPVQIYQHFIGLNTLYFRIAIHLMTQLPKRTVPVWYNDESGNYDISVKALIKYAKSEGIALPDPKIDGEPWETFSRWKEVLEEKLIQLIYNFVNGSLNRKVEVHSAIHELMVNKLLSDKSREKEFG